MLKQRAASTTGLRGDAFVFTIVFSTQKVREKNRLSFHKTIRTKLYLIRAVIITARPHASLPWHRHKAYYYAVFYSAKELAQKKAPSSTHTRKNAYALLWWNRLGFGGKWHGDVKITVKSNRVCLWPKKVSLHIINFTFISS